MMEPPESAVSAAPDDYAATLPLDELLDVMEKSERDGEESGARVPECGALRTWRAEMQAAARKVTTIDTLWRAACLEARARESEREGQHHGTNDDRRKAARLIITAVAPPSAPLVGPAREAGRAA